MVTKIHVKPKYFLYLVTIAVIVIDQISKFFIRTLSPFFDLGLLKVHLVKNTGAAFGLLKDSSLLLGVVGVAFAAAIIFFYRKSRSKLALVALGLVLGGAVGNVIDRVFFGYVVDFIDFGFWPAFNFADASLSVGVVLLLIRYFTSKNIDSLHSL